MTQRHVIQAYTKVLRPFCKIKLNGKLFHLACRHHIVEQIAKVAWEALFGTTLAPQNILFIEFKASGKIDKNADITHLQIKEKCLLQEIIRCLKEPKQIDVKNLASGDYKECLNLALVQLGQKSITLSRPGAMSEARWMAKIIYAAKMYMYSSQMNYDEGTIE